MKKRESAFGKAALLGDWRWTDRQKKEKANALWFKIEKNTE